MIYHNLTPIVRIVDDWFKNRKTALIFEAKVGKGKFIDVWNRFTYKY